MLRILLSAFVLSVLPLMQAQAQVDLTRFVDPVAVRSVSMSPSGNYVAFIRRNPGGEEIVVVDLAANSARVLESMRDDYGEFDWLAWEGDSHVLAGVQLYFSRERYSQRRTDDVSILRVVAISRDGADFVQMFEGETNRLAWGYGSTVLIDTLPNEPGYVLLAAADNLGIGVWRGEVATGDVERVADGTWNTLSYATDGVGYPVIRTDYVESTGGYRILRRASGERRWTEMMDVRGDLLATNSPDFAVMGPGPGASQVYVFARLDGQDRGAVYLYDTAAGAFGEPVHASAEADANEIWLHPTTREPIALCTYGARLTCRARDPSVQRHLNAINAFFANAATVTLADMSDDAQRWLLHASSPTEGSNHYVYDLAQRSVTPLAASYPNLDHSMLSPTEVVEYRARDGTPLWAYVTGRPGAAGPRPMVVLPHGGPESRDSYGFDPFAQFLAAQGYLVVQPNFRGSLGFGRAFADAGRGQWGRLMQDDVTDAALHMIETGRADRERVCIVGASYGGYAALAGVMLTPELYRCAVAIAGVSDLLDSLRSDRIESGRRSSTYQYWRRSMGDPGANREALIAASPARNAARIVDPVLLIHGEDDSIVPIRQSELMDEALREAGRPARFIRLEHAGHSYSSWSIENRTILYRETAAFLAQHLR